MATHSNVLAWRIPWTEESGRLVHRVTKSKIDAISKADRFSHVGCPVTFGIQIKSKYFY